MALELLDVMKIESLGVSPRPTILRKLTSVTCQESEVIHLYIRYGMLIFCVHICIHIYTHTISYIISWKPDGKQNSSCIRRLQKVTWDV